MDTGSTPSKREDAIRKTLKKFDKWVDETAAVAKHTSYYYELQGIIEDAVKAGIDCALHFFEEQENRIAELEEAFDYVEREKEAFRKKCAELEEYEKLFKANAKDFLLHKLEISGEGCEAVLEHPIVFVFASAIADYFIATNAENYVEIALTSTIGRLIVNIQKEEGKSPHEIRRELEAQVERLEDALRKIFSWSQAYPVEMFPEPDFAKVRELLAAGGIAIDCVSASNMRHVIEGVEQLAKIGLCTKEDE